MKLAIAEISRRFCLGFHGHARRAREPMVCHCNYWGCGCFDRLYRECRLCFEVIDLVDDGGLRSDFPNGSQREPVDVYRSQHL